jgi:hypothetical protein
MIRTVDSTKGWDQQLFSNIVRQINRWPVKCRQVNNCKLDESLARNKHEAILSAQQEWKKSGVIIIEV